MNNWMSYCQRKGLCPMCVKSLCVCTKGHRIRGGNGPARRGFGQIVRLNAPGSERVPHGTLGRIVGGGPTHSLVEWEGIMGLRESITIC